MSDPDHPPQRPLPQTTLQFAGHAAEHVVGGLSGRSPYMLGIVILNVLGIAAAVYFLNILIQGQQNHLKTLVDTLNAKQTEIIEMHRQEFNALLELSNKSGTPITPVAPVAPTVVPSRPNPR